MRYRKLGDSGLSVSEVGFGAWGIGGYQSGAVMAYGETDDHHSLRALHQSLEEGINFFDTSGLYGNGHSEKLLGKAFSYQRDKVIIASKAGYTGVGVEQDFSRSYLETALDQTLKRLKSDYLDVFQLHDFSGEELELQNILLTLQDLKIKGKIRAIGLSLKSPEHILSYLSVVEGVDCIQVNFNLIDQRLLKHNILTECLRRGIGVISRTPLCFGFLAGETALSFPEGDHRNRWSQAQIETWQNALSLFVSENSTELSRTKAQYALSFCLSFPISTCIPGMLNVEQVLENSQAGVIPLFSEEQLNKIQAIYQKNNFFVG